MPFDVPAAYDELNAGDHDHRFSAALAQKQAARRVVELVDWRRGTSDSVLTADADLVLMTGHVAQVLVDDEAWRVTIRHLHAALAPGGGAGLRDPQPTHGRAVPDPGRARVQRS